MRSGSMQTAGELDVSLSRGRLVDVLVIGSVVNWSFIHVSYEGVDEVVVWSR